LSIRFIRLREVLNRTGLSRSTIYALAKADLFPKPIKLGKQASAWVESEVDDWQRTKVKQRLSA
jgi:prophage regulatory protein